MIHNESLTPKDPDQPKIVTSTLASSDPLPPFRDENAFEKMQHVLAADQISVLKKMRENLKLHYETGQVFRSEVEMRFSVLNDGKFPNADAKYWQAVREQNVHFTNLVILGYEYDSECIRMKNFNDMIRRYELKQKKLQRNIAQLADELDIEEAQIEIDVLQNKIDTLVVELEKLDFFQADRKRVAYNRWREVVTWEKIMLELQPYMQFGVLSYEHHQPCSYERRMQTQYQTMIKSGAKGSPSEAINITNQNNMIKKLMEQGILKPQRELPINRAVQHVVYSIDGGNNYAENPALSENRFPGVASVNTPVPKPPGTDDRLTDIFKEEEGMGSPPINNPQIPQGE